MVIGTQSPYLLGNRRNTGTKTDEPIKKTISLVILVYSLAAIPYLLVVKYKTPSSTETQYSLFQINPKSPSAM